MRARQSVRFKETRALRVQIQIVKPKCSERYPVNLCRLQKLQNFALAVTVDAAKTAGCRIDTLPEIDFQNIIRIFSAVKVPSQQFLDPGKAISVCNLCLRLPWIDCAVDRKDRNVAAEKEHANS